LRRHPSCSCLLHRGAISSQPVDIANAPKDLVKAHTGSRSPSLLFVFLRLQSPAPSFAVF
jgi:hypothetical protein